MPEKHPCWDCPDRTALCAKTCKKLKEKREEQAKHYKQIEKQAIIKDYQIHNVYKIKKRSHTI